MILGKEQAKKLKDHIRSENGTVPIEAKMTDEITEIFIAVDFGDSIAVLDLEDFDQPDRVCGAGLEHRARRCRDVSDDGEQIRTKQHTMP